MKRNAMAVLSLLGLTLSMGCYASVGYTHTEYYEDEAPLEAPPVRVNRAYDWVYYPESEVYYDEVNRYYCYYDYDGWVTVRALPPQLRRLGRRSVRLSYYGATPYMQWGVHRRRYGVSSHRQMWIYYPEADYYYSPIEDRYVVYEHGSWVTARRRPSRRSTWGVRLNYYGSAPQSNNDRHRSTTWQVRGKSVTVPANRKTWLSSKPLGAPAAPAARPKTWR